MVKSRKVSPTTFKHTRHDLASLIRGLYRRVARRLRVDPSYVSRIARGERHSDTIETELKREMDRIIEEFSRQRRAQPTKPEKTKKSKRFI